MFQYGNFYHEIISLTSVFESNGYPKNFMDSCIKHFLDKLFVKNKVGFTIPQQQLVCVLPYTDKCFTAICVETVRLLITKKRSDIFLLERMSPLGFRI